MNHSTNSSNLICPSCHKAHVFTMPTLIEAHKNPALKDAVLDGTLFEFICPDCGYTTSVKYPTRYVDDDEKLVIDLVEDDVETVNRFEDYDDYTCRIVKSPNDLVEKILIFDANKDDRIIEMEKAILEQKLLDEGKNLKIAGMYFSPMDETTYGFAVLTEEGFSGEIPFDEDLYHRLERETLPKMDKDYLNKTEINLKWVSGISIDQKEDNLKKN